MPRAYMYHFGTKQNIPASPSDQMRVNCGPRGNGGGRPGGSYVVLRHAPWSLALRLALPANPVKQLPLFLQKQSPTCLRLYQQWTHSGRVRNRCFILPEQGAIPTKSGKAQHITSASFFPKTKAYGTKTGGNHVIFAESVVSLASLVMFILYNPRGEQSSSVQHQYPFVQVPAPRPPITNRPVLMLLPPPPPC